MEKIAHLWNVNQFMTKLNAPQITNLQTFYIETCKRLSQGAQLPVKHFGASTMCSYCGSLWSTVDHQVRIAHGRPVSKSVRKIIKSMNRHDSKIPRVCKTLGKKCVKNQTNKLVLRCSVCSESTKIPLVKPKRKKIEKLKSVGEKIVKHKKRRTRDKTAGLNISGTPKLEVETDLERSKDKCTKRAGSTTNFITPTPKLKKLNIGKLKNIVNQGTTTPSKKKSLHKFLTELC